MDTCMALIIIIIANHNHMQVLIIIIQPIIRIPMQVALHMHECAARRERLEHLRVALLEHMQAHKGNRLVSVACEAAMLVDGACACEPVCLPDRKVLWAVPGRRVHETRARRVRYVLAKEHWHAAARERVQAPEAAQRVPLESVAHM